MKSQNLSLPRKKKQDGYTMIELLLVIGIIIALAAIMLYAFLSRANKQTAIHTAASQVANIHSAESGASTRGGGPVAFTTASDATPLQGYGMEAQIAKSPTTANPWGGSYSVTVNDGAGTYTIQLQNVPSDITDKSGPYYNEFINLLDRQGEGAATAAGRASASNCKVVGKNEIDCTYDN